MIGEDEEGVYEYFYQENPPPEVEMLLPPLEDPDFPRQSIPNNMLDNPLQPAPPAYSPLPPPESPDESVSAEPRPIPQPVTKTAQRPKQRQHSNASPKKSSTTNSTNAAKRIMNPSGFEHF